MKIIGDRLRALRIAAHLSQEELADKVGKSQGQISHYEYGQEPSYATLLALANALGTTCAYLLGEHSISVETAGSPIGLNAFANAVHHNAIAHGWWDEERAFPEIVALCHSELSEALEEYRNGNGPVYYPTGADGEPTAKPEGIGVELADCIIRILDYCAAQGIDIESILETKHNYNLTRPYRHGGKKA